MIARAQQTLHLEAQAIEEMAARLDETFTRSVEIMLACHGRVVVTGMGKSGLIGQKVAATLASTGTPAFFLHPADGSHGDLGMLTRQDVVLALSNSGETQEVIALLPVIKRLGVPLISLLGRVQSSLGYRSDVVLDVSVRREACPLGLAPTSSTTAALAMGDALAVALLDSRGFNSEQFAFFHPAGNLGKKLLLRVADLMHARDQVPLVHIGETVREAILEMTTKRFGMTGVTDATGSLVGIVTDGDLRRHLEKNTELLSRCVADIMTVSPKTIREDALAVEAIKKMEEHKITSLFVNREADFLVGIIHLHDLLEAGLI